MRADPRPRCGQLPPCPPRAGQVMHSDGRSIRTRVRATCRTAGDAVMSYPRPLDEFWADILDRYRCAEVDGQGGRCQQRCGIGSTRCRRRVEASLDRSRRAAEALAPCLALPPLPSQPERTHELVRMQARPSSGQGPPTVPPHPLTAVSSRALSGLGADLGRAATVRHVWLLSDPTPHEVVSRAQH